MRPDPDRNTFDNAMNELSEAFERHTGILTLITGKVTGRDHWVYALVPPSRWPALQYVQAQGGYDLGEYASEILAQGAGKIPPDGVLDKIKADRPEMDFSFEKKLQTVLETA